MSSRVRVLMALAGVMLAVVAVRATQNAPGQAAPQVATFESTLNGEPVRSGVFEAGERVQTPAGGRVSVRTPRGVEFTIEENTDAQFATLEPLEVNLARGRLSVRSADHPLTLLHADHIVHVGPRAAVELATEPAHVVVSSGVATLDGATVTGRRALGVH